MRTVSRMGASKSAPTPGAQGTPGGVAQSGAAPGRNATMLGVEVYLWVLVLLEVAAIAFLRNHFSRYHGG